MNYVDGVVAAVPSGNREAFRQHSAYFAEVIREFGALRVVDCWGEDVPHGKVTDMYMAVQAKPDEVVCFSWIEWPSKEARDAGMARLMEDPRMKMDAAKMPFDGKRMIYGGFASLHDSKA
jgi:uncharacterized protein YbaA (DUF1428 family)